MYLGYQYFSVEVFDPNQQQTITTLSKGKILRQSVVVELTNPKTALFFLAFLPQFVDVEMGSMATQLVMIGTCYTLVTLCCDCGVALISGKLGRWLSKHPKAIYWQDRLAGGVLVGLGLLIGYEVFSNF
jgi:threonine/homoserine/homoserine lactone efflux protein